MIARCTRLDLLAILDVLVLAPLPERDEPLSESALALWMVNGTFINRHHFHELLDDPRGRIVELQAMIQIVRSHAYFNTTHLLEAFYAQGYRHVAFG